MENAPYGQSAEAGSDGDGTIVTEQVKQGAQQVAQQTQQAAGQALDTAKTQATSMIGSQKDKAAQSLEEIANALRSTEDQLRQNGQAAPAGALASVAGRIESATGYLRNHDVQDIVWDVEDVAQRNSWAFLGGAFAVGLFAARFLKSSPRRTSGGQYQYGGYASNYRGGGYVSGGTRYSGGYAGGYGDNAGYASGDAAMASGGDLGYGYLSTPSDTPAPYGTANPPYGRDDVGATPSVEIGYASGLMGETEDGTSDTSNT